MSHPSVTRSQPQGAEAAALAAALRRAIAGEARFDAGSRALYATDASNYRQVPIGVVTAFFGAPFFAVVLRTSRRMAS